jgi:hypothetical protein
VSTSTSFDNTNVPALKALLNTLSAKLSTGSFTSSDLDLMARFNLNAKFMGFDLYRALPLYKHITGQILIDLINSSGSQGTNSSLLTIPSQILLPNDQIAQNPNPKSELISLGPDPFPAIAFKSTNITLTEEGIISSSYMEFVRLKL